MRVLVIGGGAREHALACKLAQSSLVKELIAAPSNPGIASEPKCQVVPIQATNVAALLELALGRGRKVDLVVVGPEQALERGIVDRLSRAGINILGPGRMAARLETSKVYGKLFMKEHGIPTAPFRIFDSFEVARTYLKKRWSMVVKADGLWDGKGARVCATPDEAIAAAREFLVKGPIVVEEKLIGREVSLTYLVSNGQALAFEPAWDTKPIFDGNVHPNLNTGGMGGGSPVPYLDEATRDCIIDSIVTPTIMGIRSMPLHSGFLYIGLMLTSNGPQVLEYNYRFGDPECQSVLVRFDDDLAALLVAASRGESLRTPQWKRDVAASVVLAAPGYPGKPTIGGAIAGIRAAEDVEGVKVFHAATALREDGELITAGGRVLCVTALAPTFREARERVYAAVGHIQFEGGMQYRKTIFDHAIECAEK